MKISRLAERVFLFEIQGNDMSMKGQRVIDRTVQLNTRVEPATKSRIIALAAIRGIGIAKLVETWAHEDSLRVMATHTPIPTPTRQTFLETTP